MANIFMKSSWGSDDPTRAAMVFGHGNALARAALFPVGWPTSGGKAWRSVSTSWSAMPAGRRAG
jgi:hypothetical protein